MHMLSGAITLTALPAWLTNVIHIVADLVGSTPLHWAFMFGRPELALVLMDFGADPNIRTTNGLTPLELAEVYGSGDTMKRLLRIRKEAEEQHEMNRE